MRLQEGGGSEALKINSPEPQRVEKRVEAGWSRCEPSDHRDPGRKTRDRGGGSFWVRKEFV